MRYFLNRPMLIPDGRAKGADAGLTGEDSEFPLCESGHCTPIGQDPTGNHAVACRACYKSRYTLHEAVNRAIIRWAKKAGAFTEREPPTTSVLLNFASADQCRTFFPKTPNVASRVRSIRLRELVLQIHQTDHGPRREKLTMEAHAFANATPGGTKGLRLDSRLIFRDEEFWVDASVVHPTPNSKESPVTKWVKAHTAAFLEAGGLLANNAMLMEPSPCIRTAVAIKHNRYKPLLDVAYSQHKAGSRAHRRRHRLSHRRDGTRAHYSD
jgi:hypothetical protein